MNCSGHSRSGLAEIMSSRVTVSGSTTTEQLLLPSRFIVGPQNWFPFGSWPPPPIWQREWMSVR